MTNHYLIPIYERFIHMSSFGSQVACLNIDDVGVFIYHDAGQALTTDFIRRHLTGRQKKACVVEAETIVLAIRKFYDEWEGAKIGGENEHAKALWIDRVDDQGKLTNSVIEELPPCAIRHRNREGSLTCGRPIHDIDGYSFNFMEKDDKFFNLSGEYGMCGLEGYDYPEKNCPMIDYSDIAADLPINTITVNGMEFRYTSWKGAEEGIRIKKEKEAEEKHINLIKKTKIYQRLERVDL
ncbi:MAG: hypothetical protein PHW62_01590 [Candidatus Ratteibacteria bacterium]|nr:hypothetical protein [Candidatus Ratteibacteria bacterium]